MKRDEAIQKVCSDHPDLPRHVIEQVIDAKHQAQSRDHLQELFLEIISRSFFIRDDKTIRDRISYHLKARERIKPGEWIIDAGLVFELEEVFGSLEKAIWWLQQPHTSLDGERPGDFCTRHINGSLKVSELLNDLKQEMM